jgi:hypothetical protein
MHSADINRSAEAPVQLLSHILANSMKKLIFSITLAASLLSMGVATAQAYYPTNTGCISVQTGLGIGARSSSVSNLQSFLVAQNYPGGGSWMITGYFGAATAAALRNFQELQGLPQSGNVDVQTASAISRASCGGAVAITTATYPYTYPTTYPTIPTTYPPAYSYPSYLSYYGSAPTITSLSQNTGTPGSVVTVYGVGFDPYNNTINFGGTSLAGISSVNGTSLTFTVPSYTYTYSLAGTAVQLSIANTHGTSNAVSFTVWGNPYSCGGYSYGNCGGCNSYPYGYNTSSCYPQQPVSTTPIVSYLSPTSGGIGTSVTLYGAGFSTTGNSIHFGPGVIANIGSPDGRAVSFVVPSYLSGFGSQPVTLSTYQVSVVNAAGIVSNAVPFTVTSLGSSGGQPVISSVNGPTSLATGQQGVWSLNVNTNTNASLTLSVNWGDQNLYGAVPSTQQAYGAGQQSNTLTHTYYTPGTYTILFTVWNSSGQQNSYTTTVVVGGNTVGTPTISYLSPSAGYMGQQVTIYGSGFGSSNTVNFGGGVIQNISSQNNSTITFTIPPSVGPYCVPGSVCAQYLISITPGSYNVSVMNQNGTSNTIPFTVQ